jgi:alanyl-tRNA synthetase
LLLSLVDQIADKLGEGAVLLASTAGGKVLLACKASDGAVQAGAHAGEIVREAATMCGGGGGGKPGFARAGGKNPEQAAAAVAAVPEIVARQVG